MAEKALAQPVTGQIFCPGGEKDCPGPPPQGQQHEQGGPLKQPGKGPVHSGRRRTHCHHRRGGEHVEGHMGRQQKGGQQPAETEPAVLKAEGAVAQIH